MAIPWNDIEKAAGSLGVEPCALQAVCEIEGGGNGFLADGRPKILFEGHVFWQELSRRGYNPAGLLARADVGAKHGDISDILYQSWTKRFYQGGAAEYSRLDRARAVNEEAALCSASWGAFQIMGFNYGLCGYKNVREFVENQKSGGPGQLAAFCGFLTNSNLIRYLKSHDWAGFARGYNGPGYARNNYDLKLKKAYDQCVQGKK